MRQNIKTSNKKRLSALSIVLLSVLLIYVLSLVLLCIWGVFTSLKSRNDFYDNKVWLPNGPITEWAWSNFTFVFQNFVVDFTDPTKGRVRVDMFGQITNTLLYAGGCALIQSFCCCWVAYLTAKFNYRFSEILYTMVLIVMVIPIIGSDASMLVFLRKTNLFDSWIGQYIMKFNFGGMYFLVFHGVHKSISKEYSEAAIIDGASELKVFFKIIFPLISTTFYTVFLINFITYWNDYTTALIYMPTHPTLAFGVYSMSSSTIPRMSTPPMRMASCVILALPITILFVLFRDKIMGNVTMGGVKE